SPQPNPQPNPQPTTAVARTQPAPGEPIPVQLAPIEPTPIRSAPVAIVDDRPSQPERTAVNETRAETPRAVQSGRKGQTETMTAATSETGRSLVQRAPEFSGA